MRALQNVARHHQKRVLRFWILAFKFVINIGATVSERGETNVCACNRRGNIGRDGEASAVLGVRTSVLGICGERLRRHALLFVGSRAEKRAFKDRKSEIENAPTS